jgi:uncharacterized protein YbjT (DUF2867 family)
MKHDVGMTKTMTVLVTGASGTLGSAVRPRLVAEGHDVRPMSRRARAGWITADLSTGVGLTEAVRGADAIVHLATAPGRARQTRETDVAGTRRLLTAAVAAGVRHVVYVSINGADRVPLGYYRVKLAAEAVVRASGVPFTILRAAQFPTLIDTVLTVSSRLGPLLLDPAFMLQPVHVDDVAERIAELLAEPAAGRTTEFAGPQALSLDELGRSWLAARHARRPVARITVPGRTARAVRAGGLTTEAVPAGSLTWQDYLAAKY